MPILALRTLKVMDKDKDACSIITQDLQSTYSRNKRRGMSSGGHAAIERKRRDMSSQGHDVIKKNAMLRPQRVMLPLKKTAVLCPQRVTLPLKKNAVLCLQRVTLPLKKNRRDMSSEGHAAIEKKLLCYVLREPRCH
jgi:hypothetical protein